VQDWLDKHTTDLTEASRQALRDVDGKTLAACGNFLALCITFPTLDIESAIWIWKNFVGKFFTIRQSNLTRLQNLAPRKNGKPAKSPKARRTKMMSRLKEEIKICGR
jgi:hypothetical protein